MAVDSSTSVMDSLLEKLKLDDPWITPRSWDSMPCQAVASSKPPPDSAPALYSNSIVSVSYLCSLSLDACEFTVMSLECAGAVILNVVAFIFRYELLLIKLFSSFLRKNNECSVRELI